MPPENNTQTTDQTTQTTSTTDSGTSQTTDTSRAVTQDTTAEGKSLLNADGKKPDAPSSAPEAYEPWKVPEGYELAEGVGDKVNSLFKDLGLPQAAGQKLVDFYAENLKEAQQRPFQVWQDQQKAWTDEIKADPEIGGKLDEVRGTVSKVVDNVLGPDLAKAFREAMDYTGAGNNPAFVKAMFKFAERLSEGKPVSGRGPVSVSSPTGQRPSVAEAMYPNLAGKG